MTKDLYGLLLICCLLILFEGLSTDEIVSTHFIHSVFLVVYRDMSYVSPSDFSKIKLLCSDFHYYWSSLLSLSVSFPVCCTLLETREQLTILKTLRDLNSGITMFYSFCFLVLSK